MTFDDQLKQRSQLQVDVNAGIEQLKAGLGCNGEEVFAQLELRARQVMQIRREDILSPVAQQLILALNAELTDRYPEEGANFFRLDAEEVAEGRGAFYIAYIDGQPVGCGAVRCTEPAVAEIKRMYVAPSARGCGVGRQILAELEAEARRLGARRLVLETGPRQPEAIALYQRAGFEHIPLFGDYLGSPHPELSVCMAKDL